MSSHKRIIAQQLPNILILVTLLVGLVSMSPTQPARAAGIIFSVNHPGDTSDVTPLDLVSPSSAQNVVVTDALPYGVNHVSAPGNGRLFAVPMDGSDDIVELNPTTGTEINRFEAPEQTSSSNYLGDGLAFSGMRLWFINGLGSNTLWELDPNTGAVIDNDPIFLVPPGSPTLFSLATVGGFVYVLDPMNSDIYVFDPLSDVVVDFLDVDVINPSVLWIGDGLAGITGPDGLIACNSGADGAVEIDPSTGLIVNVFPFDAEGFGCATVAGEIYVNSVPSGSIDVYSRAGVYQRSLSLPPDASALGGDSAAIYKSYFPLAARSSSGNVSLVLRRARPAVYRFRLSPE